VIRATAIANERDIADVTLYGNNVLFGSSPLYEVNLERCIREKVDLHKVRALAGGIKI
jgi:hypothetical protein